MSGFASLLIWVATLLGIAAIGGFLVFSVWLSAVDIATRRLPNRLVAWANGLTLGLVAGSALMMFAVGSGALAIKDLGWLLGGAAALLALFLLLWLAVPAGIGAGDVKIAPLVGGMTAYMGGAWALSIGVAVAFACAAAWGLMLRRRGGGADVPFAPCLFAGAWFGILVTLFAIW